MIYGGGSAVSLGLTSIPGRVACAWGFRPIRPLPPGSVILAQILLVVDFPVKI